MTQLKLPFDTDRDPGDEDDAERAIREGLKEFKPFLSDLKRELDELAEKENKK